MTKDEMAALFDRVVFCGGHIEGTTITVLHALLDGQFMIATEYSACLDPADFTEELGVELAKQKLSDAVYSKLWELESYREYHDRLAQESEAAELALE